MITSLHSNTSFSWPTSESFRFIGVKDYKLKSLFGFHLFFLYLVAAEVGSIPKLFCYLSHFQQRLRSLGPHFLFRQYWVRRIIIFLRCFFFTTGSLFIFKTVIQIFMIFLSYISFLKTLLVSSVVTIFPQIVRSGEFWLDHSWLSVRIIWAHDYS